MRPYSFSRTTKNHSGVMHVQGEYHSSRIPGMGHNRNVKLSDVEVRDIRYRYYRTKETLEEIALRYPNIQKVYLKKIIEYVVRLGVACEIDYPIENKI